MATCAVCGNEAPFKCPQCDTLYCSSACQQADWNSHRLVHSPAVHSDVELSQMNNGQAHAPPDAEDLKFYLEQLYKITIPVLYCIFLSIFWVKATIDPVLYFDSNLPKFNYFTEAAGISTGSASDSLVLALIILAQVIVATIIILLLFKYNCFGVLYAIFSIIVLMLLGFFGYTLAVTLLKRYNVAMDYVTLVFLLWNFAVVGLISIFYKSPLTVQQVYLVFMSSLMAYSLCSQLPALATWILLGLLAVWDLIAVLCPFGPLKLLLESSKEQEKEIPALLYTVMIWMMASFDEQRGGEKHFILFYASIYLLFLLVDETKKKAPESIATRDSVIDGEEAELTAQEINLSTNSDYKLPPSTSTQPIIPPPHSVTTPPPSEPEEEEERSGMKLGLGDFVFYSVLISKAAFFDWITTISCTVGVMTGLNMTIFLLVQYQKALPALPISIAFGLIFYFGMGVLVVPMTLQMMNFPQRVSEYGLWVGKSGGAGIIHV
ncbi:Presenilin-1 [Nowakowskiella sp. JEL0407]|nr:Presenilin-1 [Nowakowskiella sp. JEL0407]